MFDLRVLGGLDLRDDMGRELRSVTAQPRRFAVLCYLAVSGAGRYHRRDTLLQLFWPESDTEHARHALNQAVYVLRRALGDGAILSRGDEELAVSAEVECDAARFRALCVEGRLEEALGLYGGCLLPGFHLEEAPEFEGWLEAQRSQLHHCAVEGVARLVEQLHAAGRVADALHWARTRVALAPAEVEPVRRLMLLLEEAGETRSALDAYDEHARRLRTEYELEPDAELQALATRLERGGRPVRTEPHPPRAGSGADLPGPTAMVRRHGRRRRVALLGPTLAVLLLLVLSSERPDGTYEDGRIVIFPFRVSSPDRSLAFLEQGMADLLAGAFDGDVGLHAASASAVRRALAEVRPGTSEPLRESARRLHAPLFTDGSVVSAPAGLIMRVDLVETESRRILGTQSFVSPVGSYPALAQQAAAWLLALYPGSRGAAARPAETQLDRLARVELAALGAFLDGKEAYELGQMDKARDAFLRALDIDSTFVDAAIGLEHALGFSGSTRYPRELHERAARLAWAERSRLSKREQLLLAARLGRNYPEWTSPAEQLAFIESLADVPSPEPMLLYQLGSLLFHGGNHLEIDAWQSRAAAAFERVLELDPSHPMARGLLLRLDVVLGDTSRIHSGSPWRRAPREWHFNEWLAGAALAHARGFAVPAPVELESWPEQGLRRLVIESTSFGMAVPAAQRAVDELRSRAASSAERDRVLLLERELLLNLGRPAAAAAAMRELTRAALPEPVQRERLRDQLFYAMYWDGDQAVAARAGERLESRTSTDPAERARDLCVLEQWRIARGSPQRTAESVAQLREAAADTLLERRDALGAAACAALLEAMLAAAELRPELLQLVERFDTLQHAALPDLQNEHVHYCARNLVSARLHEMAGDYEGALRAVRRRGEPGDQKVLLSTYLYEEGRLAALSGDTAAARVAFEHYLTLRYDPEPSLRPQRDRVHRQLLGLPRAPLLVRAVSRP